MPVPRFRISPLLHKFLLLCTGSFLLTSSIYCQVYDFKTYTTTDGLGKSQVFDIYQDSRGFIWFGTFAGGVSRFDGREFKNYTAVDGLANNIVFDVIEDDHGQIWFATYEGLSKFHNGEFTNFLEEDGLTDNCIRGDIAIDDEGDLWLGTNDGLTKLFIGPKGEVDSIRTYPPEGEFPADIVSALIWGNQGNLWAGTGSGLVKFDGDEFTLYTKEDGMSYNIINSLYQTDDNTVWVGTMGGGLNEFDPEKEVFRIHSEEKGLTNTKIYEIVEDDLGRLWLATEGGGVNVFNGEEFLAFTQDNGLSNNVVVSGAKDREGNLWFGTNGGGASQFRGERFVFYPTPSIVQGIARDRSGRMWFGTYGSGIFQVEDNLNDPPLYSKNITASEGLYSDRVWDFLLDSKNRFWVGCDGGVHWIENGELIEAPQPPGRVNWVHHLYEDRQGRIWFCLSNDDTLCYFQNGSYTTFRGNASAPPTPSNIKQVENGDLWVASVNGIYEFSRGSFKYYGKDHKVGKARINTMAISPNGTPWFGTQGEGLVKKDEDGFTTFTTRDGLSGNNIGFVHFDQKGNFWVGTNKGLNKVILSQKGGIKNVTHYGEEDGFKGLECQQNAVFEEDNGVMWFGTSDGAVKYDPMFDNKNTVPPKVHVTGARLFLEDTNWAQFADSVDLGTGLPLQPTLAYDQNHLTFDFVGISLTSPDQVQYRFKLEGLENDWSPPVDQNFATYSSLPPGEYTFKVKACNNDEVWSPRPATFSFTISPPFWQTWWFYGSSGLTLLLGMFGFIKVRERNLQRTRKVLAQKVEERTQQVVAQKEEIEEKNRNITDSIHYASKIQGAILTSEDYMNDALGEHFVFFKPKEVVSGDFYWAYGDEDHAVWVAADCTGHGVPGAFMSMIGNRLFNEVVLEQKERDPGRILERVRNGVIHALGQGKEEASDGMDVSLCVFDKKNNKLGFSGAKNPLYVIRRKDQGNDLSGSSAQQGGEVINLEDNRFRTLDRDPEKLLIEIKGDKQPIGQPETELEPFTSISFQLEKGDALYTFSDGFADQFGGEKGKKYRYKPFKQLLLSISDKPMKEQIKVLEKEFEDWKGDREQIDDVVVIGVRLE